MRSMVWCADLQTVGWEAIEKMGVQQVRSDAKARKKRKRRVTRYILNHVKKMKDEAAGISIGVEKDNPVVAPLLTGNGRPVHY